MAEGLTQGIVMRALDYGYDKALGGLPGLETAEGLADGYLRKPGTLQEKADSIVNWQVAKASTAGFVTNLGGVMTLPVSIPANLASVMYLQLRMVAAVAAMGGHDIRSDEVRTLAYMCMCGSAMADVAKSLGIQIGSKLAVSAINKVSGATLLKINQAVGFRLLTKFGQTGVLNLGKAVPFVGGIVGGAFDGVTTKLIGKAAVATFIKDGSVNPP